MEVTISSVMNKVYSWMFLALLVTAVIAKYVSVANTVSSIGIIVAFIVQIGIIFSLRAGKIEKMDFNVSVALFLVYAALNGYILSYILLLYPIGMITYAFLVTSAVFGVMSFIGATTKTDLTGVGKLAMIGLVTIILISVLGFFIKLPINDIFMSYAIVIIFLGLIAYETQKIKQMLISYAGTEKEKNIAIYGAFSLYIDFINLFIHILRIFASRRD